MKETNAPVRIWLQDGCEDPDCEGGPCKMVEYHDGITWCGSPINPTDTEYVRADLLPTLVLDAIRAINEAETRRILYGK